MKDFKKSDLKNRMVVEQRCGEIKIVIGDKIVGRDLYDELQDYGNNLLNVGYPRLDIVKVYSQSNTLLPIINDDVSDLELLWERTEVKEVTMSEVEEKFGCKVKIVKE